MPWLRISLVWLLILALAIANGVLREALLDQWLGAPGSLLLSGVILAFLILAVANVLIPYCGTLSRLHRFYIGLYWLVLTIVFEFSFGRFVAEKSWSDLFSQYRMEGGNLWPVVLLVILIAPQIGTVKR